MFWRVQGEEQASPIEKLLDRDDFTLEDLLLEEDVIQEVKAMNDRLIDYLKQPETVRELMKYVVEPFSAVVKLEKQMQVKQMREWEEEHSGNDKDSDANGDGGDNGQGEELGELSLGKTEEGAAASAGAGQDATPEPPKIEPLSEEELQHYALQSSQRVCEIFCCEVEDIIGSLVSDEEGSAFLGYLFSFLDQEAPLESVLAGYYSRVMVSIYQRRPTEVSDFIQAHPDVLVKLVRHLYSYSVTEFVLRLINGDEQNALYQKEQGNEWLVNTSLLDYLVEKVTATGEGESKDSLHHHVLTNAVSCVVGVASTGPSAIAAMLQEEKVVQQLLRVISKDSAPPSLIAVMDILTAMLQPRPAKHSLSPDVMISYGGFSPVAVEETVDQGMVDCAHLLLDKVAELCLMLKPVQGEDSFESSYGKIPSRLGMRRWKILDLISKVVNIVEPERCVRIVQETNLIQTCFSLVYEMPFNSILHNVVQNIVFSLLVTENKEVIMALIDSCKIHHLLSAAPAEIDSSMVELTKKSKPLRAGYFGLVTTIANQILSLSATDTQIEKKLEDDLQWTSWVVDVLVVQNKLEDPTSWECGRPSRVNDILGDMGSSSTVDLSLYSGLSVGVSSNDNDRYDDNNDDFDDMNGLDDDDDDDDDVYDTVEVVGSFQGLGLGPTEEQTEEDDNMVLISSQELEEGDDTGGQGAEVDLKLIQEKQQLKRADTPYGTAGQASAIDPQFNSANFWRSSYFISEDIADEETKQR
ncbi:SIT4 phosphatase-associated protein [Chloropicon primus]|uniref:SIT4 phosphatase-associated protein n=2 Tax=Chloropicon primus TaxID=1764295 RepID=A0A5B8MH57_9CHLO|nr:SIT4 phosphatase-associated protein [Chloropicon primus]UPQ97900.1 SIT4 phosphatase-associated protein [Chloropicon primus]|eukprot:QDZ18692.1 SIT4 phosphatase-associated protein [Chloropicon primus]